MIKGTGEIACVGELLLTIPEPSGRCLATQRGLSEHCLLLRLWVPRAYGHSGPQSTEWNVLFVLPALITVTAATQPRLLRAGCPSPGTDIHHLGSLPTKQGYV